uniref:Uncharacterized protein n=1 Tax=Arundo donax TaxID=35708 RepID=A0A0A9GPW1_ARUDO
MYAPYCIFAVWILPLILLQYGECFLGASLYNLQWFLMQKHPLYVFLFLFEI